MRSISGEGGGWGGREEGGRWGCEGVRGDIIKFIVTACNPKLTNSLTVIVTLQLMAFSELIRSSSKFVEYSTPSLGGLKPQSEP